MANTKFMISALIAAVISVSVSGCSLAEKDTSAVSDAADSSNAATITERIINSVKMPAEYSIAYEVQAVDGVVYTVKKSKDAEGNIYFKYGDEEMLFISDGDLYALYTKDNDGGFTANNNTALYTETFVESATVGFSAYSESSRKQFIPGFVNSGEQEFLGRNCDSYTVSIGTSNTSVTYSFLVDKETGICMRWSEEKKAVGHDLGSDGEIFVCTEFITENVQPLEEIIDN